MNNNFVNTSPKKDNNNKCEKCNKTFYSKYTLRKHLERKIPCDNKIQCHKCGKIFKRNEHLTNHLNRKNPCKTSSIEIEKLKLQLEIEKEKTKRKGITINNITDNSTNNSTNNSINITAPTYNVNVFNVKNITDHIEKNILTMGSETFRSIMEEHPDAKEKIIKILELTYKNENYPECKNLIYTPTCDKFFALKENDWKEVKYDRIKTIICDGLRKVIYPYMDDFKQNGKFVMDKREVIVADPNMRMHFKLSDCNSLLKKSDSTNKNKKELHQTIKTGLEL